jgi:low affinity Fe/Cu permease
MSDRFGAFSSWVAHWSGKPQVFAVAVALLLIWGGVGPLAGFSEQWQLVVNTGTTILTFLMVFIIQNTQNRHTTALQIKLDEVIRAVDGAKNELIDLEDLSEKELERLQERFRRLGERARNLMDGVHPSDQPKAAPLKSPLKKGKATARHPDRDKPEPRWP